MVSSFHSWPANGIERFQSTALLRAPIFQVVPGNLPCKTHAHGGFTGKLLILPLSISGMIALSRKKLFVQLRLNLELLACMPCAFVTWWTLLSVIQNGVPRLCLKTSDVFTHGFSGLWITAGHLLGGSFFSLVVFMF